MTNLWVIYTVISHQDNGHWAAYLRLPLLCSKIDLINAQIWMDKSFPLYTFIMARIIGFTVKNILLGFFYTWKVNNMSHRQSVFCPVITDINIIDPSSQSVGLAWMCFVGVCCHCRGFPVHWLWNEFYPNWICQSQSKVEGNTIQHCDFYKPGLLEGKVKVLKVKCIIPVPQAHSLEL